MEYSFTLRYQLGVGSSSPEETVERLGAGRCDDAIVGIGIAGRVALALDRDADTAAQAIASAIQDVRQAAPDLRLIEVGPDLIGLTDAARMIGVSRQNLHTLMKRHATTFPPPVHEGSMVLWHLSDLLEWLKDEQGYTVQPDLLEIATDARRTNVELWGHRTPTA